MPSAARRTDNPRRPSEARRARSPGGPRVGGARERGGRALRVDDRRDGTQGWHDVRRTTRRRRRRALPPFGPARPAGGSASPICWEGQAQARTLRERWVSPPPPTSCSWQRTTPPFAVVVTSAGGRRTLAAAMRFAQQTLSPSRYRVGRSRDRLRSPGIAGHAARAATGPAHGHRHRDRRAHSRQALRAGLSTRFVRTACARSGPPSPAERERGAARAPSTARWSRLRLRAGGREPGEPRGRGDRALRLGARRRRAVRRHRVAGRDPEPRRPGAPTGFAHLPATGCRARNVRLPAVYLLHGLRGSPYSFVGGLRLAVVADTLIHARRLHPFIAVMPPGRADGAIRRRVDGGLGALRRAGRRALGRPPPPARGRQSGANAGRLLGRRLWQRRHGPASSRACSARWSRGAGTSRRPGTGRSQTRAHPSAQPTTRRRSWRPTRPSCARAGVRFFVSAGRRERKVLLASRDFARELAGVRLEHVLDVTAGGHHGGTWRAVLPVGLRYAFAR